MTDDQPTSSEGEIHAEADEATTNGANVSPLEPTKQELKFAKRIQRIENDLRLYRTVVIVAGIAITVVTGYTILEIPHIAREYARQELQRRIPGELAKMLPTTVEKLVNDELRSVVQSEVKRVSDPLVKKEIASQLAGRDLTRQIGDAGGTIEREGDSPVGVRLSGIRWRSRMHAEATLQAIAQVESIRRLSLQNSDTEDSDLVALYALHGLESLDLRGTHVSADGIEKIRRRLERTEVVADF